MSIATRIRCDFSDITHNNAGSTPTICDYNYGYDDAGRPRWREDTVTSHLSEIYGYDNANRLTTFERGILAGSPPYDVNTNTTFTDLTQIESWNLDLVGNWDEFMRQVDASTNTIDYDFNVANEITTSGYTHDANGNLSCDGTYYYDYDINNRLTRMRVVSGGGTVMEYYYDALGRRIQRLNPLTEPADETLFVHNERWQLIEVCDGNTSGDPAMKRFIHAGASLYVDDHVAMDVRASAMSEFDSTDRYYYHADKQFNTMAMTDNTGAIAERVVTDPYGRFVTYDSSYANAQATSRVDTPFFHQGLYYDAEAAHGSGAGAIGVGYQNRAREYSARLGRFCQRDPRPYADANGLYVARSISPMIYVDSSGHLSIIPPGVLIIIAEIDHLASTPAPTLGPGPNPTMLGRLPPAYGNYCGPGWTGGLHDGEQGNPKPPIDKTDSCCARHDSCFVVGQDNRKCNHLFCTCLLTVPANQRPEQWESIFRIMCGSYPAF